jgi:PAS domain S-box-containing protein
MTFSPAQALQALVGESPANMCALDLDGVILAVSRGMIQQTGVPLEDYIGRRVQDLFGGSGMEEILAKGQSMAAHTIPPRRIIAPDGEVVWVETSNWPWLDADGRVGGLVCLNRNITVEQKALAELTKAETLLEAVFDSIPSHLAVQDMKTGDFVRINRAAETMLGRPRSEILRHGRIRSMSEDASKRHWDQIELARSTGEVVASEE